MIAEAVSDAAPASGPVSARTEIPGQVELTLSPGTPWRLTLESDRWWAEPAIVTVGESARPAELVAVPGGLLAATLAAPPDETKEEPPPEGLDAAIAWNEGRVVRSSCTQGDRGAFHCPLPAGSRDVKLIPRGERWAPLFLWDVAVPPGEEVAAGPFRLVQAGSLAGTVLDGPAGGPIAAADVRLTPRAVGGWREREDSARLELASYRARVRGGELRIPGVAPGDYELRITQPGYSPLVVPSVRIAEGQRLELDEPVTLLSTADLEVFLTPPQAPDGLSWRLWLFRRTPDGGLTPSSRQPEDAESGGYHRVHELPVGAYELHVGTGASPRWLRREIELEPGRNVLHVEVGAIQVDGRVLSGEQPVQATLWFGGRHGPISIRMDSDREGRFFGALPRPGEWKLEIERHGARGLQNLGKVMVESAPGDLFAALTVELPATRLEGEVLDGSGKGLRAIVQVLNVEERRIEAMTRSDAEGSFEITGLAPGAYLVDAEASGARSPSVEVDLSEDGPGSDVTLTVSPASLLVGRVVSGGALVPGARIVGFPELPSHLPAPVLTATSGVDGTFELELPAETTRLRWIVQAPGRPVGIGAVTIPTGTLLVEVPSVGGQLRVLVPASEALTSLTLWRGDVSLNLQWLAVLGFPVSREPSGPREIVSLPDVAPDTYTVCLPKLSGASPTNACDSTYVAPGGESWIDMTESEGDH